ncbi:DUF3306 domain-containing protein [Pseudoduganella plicata]|uniref:DUF3306 domain-containing protein n=1 Tax=Pseudoduganella plicata TaxID=321984 RepID=A0A4P7BMT8_9BURK|nr:DUF3306 domain-containing protein [Pseudoduganella plicata]QBQ39075.1 DUF3306 domain-containing protein [Pseudoduganella plicata]GGY87050.1 hypothetical protein GCM10007388_20450 [Pseudoduganella plicata]
MPEGFLRRWSRLKATGEPEAVPARPAAPASAPVAVGEAAPLPTLADVAQLGADADFSRFVAPDVDSAVRRLALKKMFADPHFNAIDGLDIYMGDFTKADPIPAAMMAALQHARSVFGPASEDEDARAVRDPAEPPASDPAEPSQADPASPTHTDPAEPAGTPAITPHTDETTV